MGYPGRFDPSVDREYPERLDSEYRGLRDTLNRTLPVGLNAATAG